MHDICGSGGVGLFYLSKIFFLLIGLGFRGETNKESCYIFLLTQQPSGNSQVEILQLRLAAFKCLKLFEKHNVFMKSAIYFQKNWSNFRNDL